MSTVPALFTGLGFASDDTAASTPSTQTRARHQSPVVFVAFLAAFALCTTLAGVLKVPSLKYVQIPLALALAVISSRVRESGTLENERKDRDAGTAMTLGFASIAMTSAIMIGNSRGPRWKAVSLRLIGLGFACGAVALLDDNGEDTSDRLNKYGTFRTCAINLGISLVLLGVLSGMLVQAAEISQ